MSDECKVRMDAPAGLVIETSIDSSLGSCRIDSSESASHVIEIQNRTSIPYKIMIRGKCETTYIRYGHGGDIANSWDVQILVPPRPATGGSSRVMLRSDLTCTSASKNEAIKISVAISAADSVNDAPFATASALLVAEALG